MWLIYFLPWEVAWTQGEFSPCVLHVGFLGLRILENGWLWRWMCLSWMNVEVVVFCPCWCECIVKWLISVISVLGMFGFFIYVTVLVNRGMAFSPYLNMSQIVDLCFLLLLYWWMRNNGTGTVLTRCMLIDWVCY